jgi:hypothetical protein
MMKRLFMYAVLLLVASLAVVVVLFFRPHPEPAPVATVVTPKAVTVKEMKGTVVPPLKAGDPITVRLEQPEGRWKSVVLAAKPADRAAPPAIDVGLGYEIIQTSSEEKTITLPFTGWELGTVKFPGMSLDAIATANRAGLGGSLKLTEHVDLEAGISRRWDDLGLLTIAELLANVIGPFQAPPNL